MLSTIVHGRLDTQELTIIYCHSCDRVNQIQRLLCKRFSHPFIFRRSRCLFVLLARLGKRADFSSPLGSVLHLPLSCSTSLAAPPCQFAMSLSYVCPRVDCAHLPFFAHGLRYTDNGFHGVLGKAKRHEKEHMCPREALIGGKTDKQVGPSMAA